MIISKESIQRHNEGEHKSHERKCNFIKEEISNVEYVIEKIQSFQIAVPSWALGTGGTRFGRFSGPGEPSTLEQKIEDVGLIHALNRSSGAISLHIPWDIPENRSEERRVGKECR